MDRRSFVTRLGGVTALSAVGVATDPLQLLAAGATGGPGDVDPLVKSNAEWKRILSKAAYRVLRHEDTERAGTSPLDREKRAGTFVCAGCFLPLFGAAAKYDSGTGWPSFWQPIDPDHVGTKKDFKLVWPRTEYHRARCGGHQGHIFGDGPAPTGKRYCNNGVALRFVPDGEALPALRT